MVLLETTESYGRTSVKYLGEGKNLFNEHSEKKNAIPQGTFPQGTLPQGTFDCAILRFVAPRSAQALHWLLNLHLLHHLGISAFRWLGGQVELEERGLMIWWGD